MRILLFNVVVVVVCTYAFWRGGGPERCVAIMFVIAAATTRAAAQHMVEPFVYLEANLLLVDATLLCALVAVALFADRFWPMTMAAFQVVLVCVHLLKMINPAIIPTVYAVSLGLWSYPMIALLGWGTYQHRKRLRLYGVDVSWSHSWRRSLANERSASQVY